MPDEPEVIPLDPSKPGSEIVIEDSENPVNLDPKKMPPADPTHTETYPPEPKDTPDE